MRESELVRRADMALSDLATSGVMNPEQEDTFFRRLIDQPTIVQSMRVVPMRSSKREINKIGFGSRLLRAADQGLVSSPRSGEDGTRALARADRGSPVTSKIELSTKELIAEVVLKYEVIEDNIEGGDVDNSKFEQTIIDMIAERVALDLEEWVLLADSTSGDPFLALTEGVLKRTSSNIVNSNGAAMSPSLFGNMVKSLPTKYHRLLNQMRFYSSVPREIDYRTTIAQRQTSLGDAVLTGSAPVSVLGVPLSGAALMPNDTMLLTIARNLVLGVQRNTRMEFDRDTRERAIIIVLTMRVDTQIEEEDMVVKATNIGGL